MAKWLLPDPGCVRVAKRWLPLPWGLGGGSSSHPLLSRRTPRGRGSQGKAVTLVQCSQVGAAPSTIPTPTRRREQSRSPRPPHAAPSSLAPAGVEHQLKKK